MKVIAVVILMIGLLITNPDEATAKSWLIDRLRAEVAEFTSTPQGEPRYALVEGVTSAYAPKLVESWVSVRRRNFGLFSIYGLTPQGPAALWLELSGRKILAREGICLVAIAGSFLPCNAAARAWAEGQTGGDPGGENRRP